MQDTALFTSSLSSLASTGNFFELSNFNQLNQRFDAIAKDLTITTTNTTFELQTPSFGIGTKIRMTFDGVSAAGASSRYVEGTVAAGPSRTYMLTNISYGGTSSDNSVQIAGVMNGTEVIYTFTNFKGYDPSVDKQVKQWTQRAGSTIWQVNSEYEAANSTSTTTEYKSAVVYIALDASRSLSDSDITAVRTAMKRFVQTLYDRSQNKTAAAPAPAPVVTPQTGTLVVTTMTAGTLTVTGSGVNQSANLSAGGNWSKTDLAAGAYTLTMRYSDGKSESKTASITGSQVAVAGFTYQPPPPGSMRITTVTAGTLTVTGSGVNQSATLSAGGRWNKDDLPPGSYTVTMRYSDGKSESKTVGITGSQVAVAGFTYQPPPPGSMRITTVTAGTLTVTGSGVNQSATLSAGGSWNKGDLPLGSYTVTMRYPDGRSDSNTVLITDGKVVAVSFTYQPAPVFPSSYTVSSSATFRDAIATINSAPAGDYTITVTGNFSASAVAFTGAYPQKTITLQGDGSLRTISNSADGNLFSIPDGITLVLRNNIRINGNIKNKYSLVSIAGGTLRMETGATISGNGDCGVYVDGTFTMRGGTISGNGTSGVYVRAGTFTMSGGTISGNADSGVYIGGGMFAMNGGTISGNTTIGFGGGVCVSDNGTFIKTGGTIDSTNKASRGRVAYSDNAGSRVTTAGPGDNMDSRKKGSAGGW